jgi:hypothetical protein
LYLNDLGYFVLRHFQQIDQGQAYFPALKNTPMLGGEQIQATALVSRRLKAGRDHPSHLVMHEAGREDAVGGFD